MFCPDACLMFLKPVSAANHLPSGIIQQMGIEFNNAKMLQLEWNPSDVQYIYSAEGAELLCVNTKLIPAISLFIITQRQ